MLNGGIKEGKEGICFPPPTCLPSQKKKWPKSAIFGKLWFIALYFAPTMPHKKFSGAATAYAYMRGQSVYKIELAVLTFIFRHWYKSID